MKEALSDSINALLPDRKASDESLISEDREKFSREKTEEIARKEDAKRLAAARRREEAILKRKRKNGDFSEREKKARIDLDKSRENLELIKELEQEVSGGESLPAILQKRDVVNRKGARLLALQGTTRAEVQQLLDSLNINLNIHLTRSDTNNLLATLLTCNERQLDVLYNDGKIPMAIKIIIKRLKEDVKNGNTATVERLWDRIFGKPSQEPPSSAGPAAPSLSVIPDAPVSREALILIKDTIVGQ